MTTLLVPQLLDSGGLYPGRDGGGPSSFTLGMIQSFGGMSDPFGAKRCEGQMIPKQSNPDLFSVIGNAYGGGGTEDFAYPQLDNVTAVGGGPGWPAPKGALSTTPLIAASTMEDAPLPGTVIAFTGDFAPTGWLLSNGAELEIAQYPALYSVIGTAFGGDGKTSFRVPDLSVSAPLGISSSVKLGQFVDGPVPGVGMRFLIAFEGLYPQLGGTGGFPSNDPFLGQIIAWASDAVPHGWMACEGQLLPIQQYAALFQVLGLHWGGDGVSTFALPDLRGKMIAGLP